MSHRRQPVTSFRITCQGKSQYYSLPGSRCHFLPRHLPPNNFLLALPLRSIFHADRPLSISLRIGRAAANFVLFSRIRCDDALQPRTFQTWVISDYGLRHAVKPMNKKNVALCFSCLRNCRWNVYVCSLLRNFLLMENFLLFRGKRGKGAILIVRESFGYKTPKKGLGNVVSN